MSGFADKVQVSGLAGTIRASIVSDQFDLGGYNEVRTRELISNAFAEPLEAPNEMVRYTFVVGGGKQVRSKYAEELPKWMASALRDIGFTEDRSAAETFDSQGTYKQQHDTGQNLKYVIVYPRVRCAEVTINPKSNDNDTVDTTSPEYITAVCELNTLQDIVGSKCPSYRQQKCLLHHLQKSFEEFQHIEAKLISGAALDAREDNIYSANSGMDAEKIAWLQKEIKQMVDKGQLTESEKNELLKSMEVNEETVRVEIEAAKNEGKTKLLEKLNTKREAIEARRSMVASHTPIIHRLSNTSDIQKLYLALFPLRSLEEKGRSMSLTLSDLKKLEEKSDLEEAIRALEASSRGWFQEEEDFLNLCRLEEQAALSRYKSQKALSSKKSGGKTGQKSMLNTRGWTTATNKSRPAVNSNTTKQPAGGNTFAAAFSESDSD